MRGYSLIVLHTPKDPNNIGGVLRAASCYGSNGVITINNRAMLRKGAKALTNTSKAHRHIPYFDVQNIDAIRMYDCVRIGVELVPGAEPLPEFKHPERAMYIFGPEDGTLGKKVLDTCIHVVKIPMVTNCMNLAATVNVVLYDRLAKRHPPTEGQPNV